MRWGLGKKWVGVWHVCKAKCSVTAHSQETSSLNTMCAHNLSVLPSSGTEECVSPRLFRAAESLLHAPLKFYYHSPKIYSLHPARLAGTAFLEEEALSAVLFLQVGVGEIRLLFSITFLSWKLQNDNLRVLGNGKTHMIPLEMQKHLKRLCVAVCGGGVCILDSYLSLLLMSRDLLSLIGGV